MKFEITPTNYIKTTKKDFDLLGETMVIMGADLFQALYDMMEDSDFTSVASQIRDASIEFERELDWKTDGTEERDYLLELERFEAKKLEEWRKIYS